MRPIDADKLIDCVSTVQEWALAIGGDLEAIKPVNEGFISLINSMPTIEAEPVKYAKWIKDFGCGEKTRTCSSCHITQSVYLYKESVMYKYCPFCGAKMDEVKHDTSGELIRCKDCKHHHEAHYEEDGEKPIIKHKCKLLKGYQFSENHYCGFAERKEE